MAPGEERVLEEHLCCFERFRSGSKRSVTIPNAFSNSKNRYSPPPWLCLYFSRAGGEAAEGGSAGVLAGAGASERGEARPAWA